MEVTEYDFQDGRREARYSVSTPFQMIGITLKSEDYALGVICNRLEVTKMIAQAKLTLI